MILSLEWRGTNSRRAYHQGWRGLRDNVKDGKTTCAARIQNTPPLQALPGLRVVVSVLGNSRLKALCSGVITHLGGRSRYTFVLLFFQKNTEKCCGLFQ